MNAKTQQATIAMLVVPLACTPATSGPAEDSASPDQQEAPTNRIEIPATVRSNLGITFATVEARHVASTLRVPGAFELRPLSRREYHMALAGKVELLVDQYDRVEPGQPLFRFQSPAWPELMHEIIVGEQEIDTALGEIQVAKAKATETRRNLELARGRIQALAQADFKKADLEREAAELEASLPRLDAEMKLAQTRLLNARKTREHAMHRAGTAAGIAEGRLEERVFVGGESVPHYQTIDWIEVQAVVAGVVEMLAITDGAFVESPDVVLSTVDTEQVRFRALALQGDLPKLMGALEARIVPPRSPGIPIGASVPATMTLGLEAHPDSRTITLLASPEGSADWIRPGVSAFLEVVVDSTAAPALAVPRSSIVRDGLIDVFFRRDPADPNLAIRTEADLGVSDGRWIVLQSGVLRGDEVVLDGAYELKLAMEQSGGAKGGHFHADGSFHDE